MTLMQTPMFFVTLAGCLFIAVYALLIAYYRKAWKAIPGYPSPVQTHPPVRISVLIPARNEEMNIGACLDSLARQTYPCGSFEVIVIDDHSTDATAALVKGFAATESGRRLAPVCLGLAGVEGAQTVRAHKKFAIETGVAAATGELIVTTDADCIFHPQWLSTLAAYYIEKGAKFIAAPVRIGDSRWKMDGGFLYIFQTLDFITLQGITGASVHKKFHSMCNGANLAYEKKAFYEVGGFKDIDSIPSGDDLLLMHKIYKKYPEQVFFLKSRQAIVSTRPETDWKGFINQRVRWASKAGSYDDRRIFRVLLLVYLVNVFFAGLAVAGCWNSWWWLLGLLLLLVKTVVEYPFVRVVAGFFGQQRLLVYFPVLQPFHILYTIIIGWLGQFGHYRWKDRKISK